MGCVAKDQTVGANSHCKCANIWVPVPEQVTIVPPDNACKMLSAFKGYVDATLAVLEEAKSAYSTEVIVFNVRGSEAVKVSQRCTVCVCSFPVIVLQSVKKMKKN